ncbi:MAG: hypothetical protein OHK0019_37900 [Saprospiraceae bacterium]
MAQCPTLGSVEGFNQPAICAMNSNNLFTYTYTIPNGAPANLVWTITPPGSGVFNGPSVGASVVVNWQVTGPAQLCATPTNPCYDPTPICLDVDVQPMPYVEQPPNVTVCPGEQVFHHFTGNAWEYFWSNSFNLGQQAYCPSGSPPNGTGDVDFIATNSDNIPLTCIMAVYPRQGDCIGNVKFWTVTVLPAPTMTKPADVSVCGGAPVAVTFTGTPGATFSWTNDNPAIGLAASGTGNLNFITLKSPQTQTANITVTPVYVSGNHACPGDPVTFSITVNNASMDDPPNITVCPYTPVSVVFAGSGDTYSWTNNNNFIGLDFSGSGDLNFTAEGTAIQQVATITVTPQPCPFASQTFTITVLPAPAMDAPPDISVCAGKQVSVTFTGSAGTTFSWTNSNPTIGLGPAGSGSLLNFTAANVATTQIGTITVTPSKGGCTGQPLTFNITVEKCCATDAGTLDTASLFTCGPKTLSINHLGNQNLEPNDTIRFILYSNPNSPLTSILQYSDSLKFPFLPGITEFDTPYYLAVIAGNQLSNDSIDTADPCFSLVKGPKIIWRKIPAITVGSPPESVCSDGCVDVLFEFTGSPPFEFNWLIEQGGQILLLKAETSDALQKIITICPSDFDIPGSHGDLHFRVNFLQDKFCGCGD